MAEFFNAYGTPSNFLLGTSCIASTARVRALVKIREARLWVSAEPLWKRLDFRPWLGSLSWIVAGGESGPTAAASRIEDLLDVLAQCAEGEVPAFMKQLGSRVFWNGCAVHLKSHKGGNWQEWHESLRVRQMPEVRAHG